MYVDLSSVIQTKLRQLQSHVNYNFFSVYIENWNPKEIETLQTVTERNEKLIEKLDTGRINKWAKRAGNNNNNNNKKELEELKIRK